MPKLSDLHVGDLVQVIPGTTDQSLYGNTGVLITTRYTTAGNLFMTITQKGLKSNPSADYLVLSYGSTVITATKASFIGSNYICNHKPATPKPTTPTIKPSAPAPVIITRQPHTPLTEPYTTVETATSWTPDATGDEWVESIDIDQPVRAVLHNVSINKSESNKLPNIYTTGTTESGIVSSSRGLTSSELRSTGTNKILKNSIIRTPAFESNLDWATLTNSTTSRIQNNEQYPVPESITSMNSFKPRKYDYKTFVDPNLPGIGKTLRESLGEFRKLYGLPIHGEKAISQYMKYFLYNRYKVPDTNLAFNRSFTHVFFTRPDLNILQKQQGGSSVVITDQCSRHTESTMIWHKNPELFKLLVDRGRIGDNNNFNLLLSNQINNFNITPETLESTTHGKSWNGYDMNYGIEYTGRTSGELDLEFTDTRDLDIFHLIKLWMTYIDNVSRGAWSPSYNLPTGGNSTYGSEITNSHVYTRTLDYAASIYLIKVAENGEDIIYWTKYYGVYPVSTGAEALSWSLGQPEGAPKLNIRFKYAMKRDINPINLVEFNSNAGTIRDREYIKQFNPDVNASTHPYVGSPYIEMLFPEVDGIRGNDVARGIRRSWLKLRFDQEFIESRSISYKNMFY